MGSPVWGLEERKCERGHLFSGCDGGTVGRGETSVKEGPSSSLYVLGGLRRVTWRDPLTWRE